MSLPVLAQHLASKGRDEDTMLVHMTPGEVKGLQALALAHGGSLSINPETGLVEAGWLKKLLPAIAGFALNAVLPGVGTAVGGLFGLGGAAGTAITVGGIAGLAKGSLKEGILAGLGAYGGASLAGGLMNAGAAAANQSIVDATLASNPGLTAGEIAREMGTQGFVSPSISAGDVLTSGVKSLASPEGRGAFMAGVGGPSGLMRAGYAAAIPVMADQAVQTTTPAPQTPSYLRPFAFDPGTGNLQSLGVVDASKINYPQPYSGYNDGGMVAFAEGGETEKEEDPYAKYYTQTGDSKAAYDYLMGRGPYPVQSSAPVLAKPYNLLTGGREVPPPAAPPPVGAPPTVVNPEVSGGGGGGGDGTLISGGGAGTRFGGSSDPIDLSRFQNAGPPSAPIEGDDFSYTGGLIPYLTQRGPDEGPVPVEDRSVYARDFPVEPSLNDDSLSYGLIPYLTQRGADEGPVPVVDYSIYSPGFGGGSGGGGGFNPLEQDTVDQLIYGLNTGGIAGLPRMAAGGQYNLGGYSDGGRLLKGPGDGVSDSIPATIGDRQPARLADGEFVVPARIVSELGNGSTDAGARQLYAMMDRIQKSRRQTVGKDRVAQDTNAAQYLPA